MKRYSGEFRRENARRLPSWWSGISGAPSRWLCDCWEVGRMPRMPSSRRFYDSTRAGLRIIPLAVNTWFYRILTNACIDELRRVRPLRPLDGLELPAPDTPDRSLARRERDTLLQIALASVPLEARIALTLYYGTNEPIRRSAPYEESP